MSVRAKSCGQQNHRKQRRPHENEESPARFRVSAAADLVVRHKIRSQPLERGFVIHDQDRHTWEVWFSMGSPAHAADESDGKARCGAAASYVWVRERNSKAIA
jgi:hypothetical protein